MHASHVALWEDAISEARNVAVSGYERIGHPRYAARVQEAFGSLALLLETERMIGNRYGGAQARTSAETHLAYAEELEEMARTHRDKARAKENTASTSGAGGGIALNSQCRHCSTPGGAAQGGER